MSQRDPATQPTTRQPVVLAAWVARQAVDAAELRKTVQEEHKIQ
jgi:hypothetical protein